MLSAETPECHEPTRTNGDDDLAMQLAVLQRVLDVRPVRLTVPELIRELAGEEVEFAPVMRLSAPPAIYPVLRHLHLDGDLIFPTRAAIRNREMLDR